MMDMTKKGFAQIRAQIFEALDADAVKTLSKSALSQQLANAVDMLVEKFGLSVSA